MKALSGMVLILAASLCTVTATADPTVVGCPKNTQTKTLSLSGSVTSTFDCELLEDNELLKLVNKFAAGTIFAYPAIQGTCFSGELSGTLTDLDDNVLTVTASAASAQGCFPVPSSQAVLEGMGLAAESGDRGDGGLPPPSLAAGAAMTALRMDINGSSADVLIDDHFLSTEIGDDTEDFLILGSGGDLRLSGRLVGRGQLIPSFDGEDHLTSLTIDFEYISGNVCVSTK